MQDRRWGAYLGEQPVLDLCYGCGSAIDTIEDEHAPAPGSKDAETYNKRTSLLQQTKEDTLEGATLKKVIACASAIVTGLDTAQNQGIVPAGTCMVTQLSQKTSWDVGFVTEEWWAKSRPPLASCGINRDYYYDHQSEEWVPGLIATTQSLKAAGVPYKLITMTAKRKCLTQEELLAATAQIRMGHAQSVWRIGCKDIVASGPAKLQGSMLEIPKWGDYDARHDEYKKQLEAKKLERERARKLAEQAVLGIQVPEPCEAPAAVVETKSAFASSQVRVSAYGKGASKQQPTNPSSRTQLPPTTPGNPSWSLPPGVEPTHYTRSPAAAARSTVKSDSAARDDAAVTLKKEAGAGAATGGKAGRRTQAKKSASASVGPSTPRGTAGNRSSHSGSQVVRRKVATVIPTSKEVSEVDQSQWKDFGVNEQGLLDKTHVQACIDGWKGLKTVNAVPCRQITWARL